jgi:hypothetical protein
MVEEGYQMMLQVAGGILIAAIPLGLLAGGLVVGSQDKLGGAGLGMAFTGVVFAIIIIYLGLA